MRPILAYRTRELRARLREDLLARVELTLYSAAQGRIPYGAWPQLLEPLLEAYLAKVHEAEARGPLSETVT